MKRILVSISMAAVFALLHYCGNAATNLVSNTAIVTNRVQGIVTYTMSNGVARVQDPSGKLVGTAEERALKVAAEGQADIASAAADAAGTAMEEWREFTATTDVKVVYIDAGFTQDLPALAPNLCGWVAGSFYDREKGEDHYYVWFNREMDYPPSMAARIVSESGTNWLDGAWVDWAVTNWIDKATGRESVMPTARDYVQDGLIAMWDGIENAGWGVHDSAATVWKDLVGTHDVTLTANGRFEADALVCNTCSAIGSSALSAVPITVEAVVETYLQGANLLYWTSGLDDGSKYYAIGISSNRRGFIGYDYYFDIQLDSQFHSLSYECDTKLTVDGVSRERKNTRNYWGKSTDRGNVICFGGFLNSPNQPYYVGRIKSLRAYSRALTDAEIAHNYDVDRVRFFGDNPPVPCRELVVPRRNANCVLKTGTVITLGGRDGFDADIHKVNVEVNGEPTVTTSAQLPIFNTVTHSGTNRVTRAYTNGFLNVENGFIKEPTND